jgi:hypothetical protein
LHPDTIDIPYASHAALEIDHARTIGGSPPAPLRTLGVPPSGTGLHTAALYSAFALIAAIVFGTLSVHPF